MRRTCVVATVALTALTALVGAAADSPVADAAMRRDLASVRSLIAGGADVSVAQGDGLTALHWAARHGDRAMATALIGAGANLAAVTRLGAHTPLHVAGTTGAANVVEALLEAGADPAVTTTTGAAALHFAAGAGNSDAVAALLRHSAAADAREHQWGQTPLMFAAAADRVAVIETLLAAGADPGITANVVDITARNEADSADRRERNRRVATLRARLMGIEQPAQQARSATEPEPTRSAEARDAAAVEVDLQEEPEPLGYADLIGAHGGLTALLLAAREGHAGAVLALLGGGADINQPSAADRTSPLVMATINGHFDLAMRLLEEGADSTLASDAGATSLYAALNMHWAPKSRHPQPTDYMQQETSYLELMEALIAAGAEVNARLTKSLWYTTYNRDMLGVDRTGATPFWRAAYALDLAAMKMLLAHGADPTLPTTKVPERRRRGDDTGHSGLPPVPLGGPAVYPIHAASGVGYGQGFAANTHRHVPDAWLPTVKFLVEELGADVNARDHKGYTPVHHAASRGDNALIEYLVSKGAEVTGVSRRGHTTADLANGPVQRTQPFPETIELLVRLGAKNNNRCVSC